MAALTSNCVVPFSLTKRNDIGVAYANVYLSASPVPKYIPQFVNVGSSVLFNKFTKLASIAWLKPDELTFLQNGSFRVQFFINFTNNFGKLQLALFVNGLQVAQTFGTVGGTTFNGGQVNGEFTVKVSIGDVIRLVNVGSLFVVAGTGIDTQVLANLTVTEITMPG